MRFDFIRAEMDKIIYGLCALTSGACAWLLLRRYAQARHRLLFWSGLCFVGLTINNVLLVLDRVVLPMGDLSLWRLLSGLVALLLLLFGLIWERD
jgi:hypothetical protein